MEKADNTVYVILLFSSLGNPNSFFELKAFLCELGSKDHVSWHDDWLEKKLKFWPEVKDHVTQITLGIPQLQKIRMRSTFAMKTLTKNSIKITKFAYIMGIFFFNCYF